MSDHSAAPDSPPPSDELEQILLEFLSEDEDGSVNLGKTEAALTAYINKYYGGLATSDVEKQPKNPKPTTQWWICHDNSIATKILGPFNSQGLAVKVRVLLEFKNSPKTYWLVFTTKADIEGTDLELKNPEGKHG